MRATAYHSNTGVRENLAAVSIDRFLLGIVIVWFAFVPRRFFAFGASAGSGLGVVF